MVKKEPPPPAPARGRRKCRSVTAFGDRRRSIRTAAGSLPPAIWRVSPRRWISSTKVEQRAASYCGRKRWRDIFTPHVTISQAGKDGKGGSSYGYGWTLTTADDGQIVPSHGGALACTAAQLVRLPGNISFAVLFNLGQSPDGKFLGRQINLSEVIRNVEKWPEDDAKPNP